MHGRIFSRIPGLCPCVTASPLPICRVATEISPDIANVPGVGRGQNLPELRPTLKSNNPRAL